MSEARSFGDLLLWTAFKKVEQEQNRVYDIDYKIDLHSIYLILDLYVGQEFAGILTWCWGPIQLFVSTYTEAKHNLFLLKFPLLQIIFVILRAGIAP